MSIKTGPLINLKIADHSHLPEIADLVNQAYRGSNSRVGWTTEADLLDGQRTDPKTLADVIQHKDKYILMAGIETKLDLCSKIELFNSYAEMGMFTVRPTLQSKGLGTILLNSIEKWLCEKTKVKEIEIHVISLRHELIDWYKKRGFVKMEKTLPFPYGQPKFGIPKREDLEFIVMKKCLLS